MHNKSQRGFTLIELMIVVIIVATLASIALPSYLDHVRRGNRSDAIASLSNLAQQMERCRSSTGTFKDCGAASVTKSDEEFYKIKVTVAGSGDGFSATATADKTPQTGDTECKTFTLDHLGQRTSASTDDCW